MSENNPIAVFASHVFEENYDYLRVFEFLESVDRFYYINVSKPENIPTTGGLQAIKNELIEQIKTSEALFIISSVYEQRQDIVKFIMDVAEAQLWGAGWPSSMRGEDTGTWWHRADYGDRPLQVVAHAAVRKEGEQ